VRKIVLLVVVIVLIAFGLLLASKLVPGFDAWASSSVLAPVATFFGGLVTSITAHPFWQTFGNYISFGLGIFTFILLAYVIWPRAKKVKPQLQSSGGTGLSSMQREPAEPERSSTVRQSVASPESKVETEEVAA